MTEEFNNHTPAESSQKIYRSGETSGDFNLSDKITDVHGAECDLIFIEDVREFVRLLKEIDMGQFIDKSGLFLDGMFQEEIDKLAGEKLI